MNTKKLNILCLLLVTASLPLIGVSCAKKATETFATDVMYEMQDNNGELTGQPSRKLNATRALASEVKTEAKDTIPAETERKLVYTGSLSVQVTNLATTENDIRTWVTQWNGYITNTSTDVRSLSVTARIPAASFQDAMNATTTFGKAEHRSIFTEDVTEQYYDTATRLETRKILRTRLQNYLTTATDMKNLIAVEKELNDVQSDIESMEGRFRRLSNRIDYATITIDAFLPVNTDETGFLYPDLAEKARELWANTLEFFASLLFALVYVIVFGIPLLAIIALMYWVSFGRIGLIKKLFKRLK